MSKQIQTPLLQIFANFYGNLSFQFFPINTSSFLSLINLLQNITIFIIVICSQIFFDCYDISTYVAKISHLRPFMAIIFSSFIKYSYPVLNFTNILYYFFYGRQIIKLLDNDFFFQVYASFPYPKLVFTAYIAVLQLYTGLLTFDRMITFIQQFTLISLLNIFTLLAVSTMLILNYVVIHYYIYGTKRSLEGLKSKYESNVINCEELFKSLRSLARINEKLNCLLSLPFSTFLVIVILDNITTMCLFVVLEMDSIANFIYTFFLHNSAVCLYIVYLVTLNKQVINCFRITVEAVKVRKELKNLKVKEKMAITREEMAIYESSFHLSIFNMWNVTHGNLFSMMLFIVGYTVFLYQTK